MNSENKRNSFCIYDDNSENNNTVSILAGGDFCPIRSFDKAILEGKPVFDDTLCAEMKNKDVFLINLEAPLCETGLPGAVKGGGLRGAPETADTLKKLGVDVASIANNHVRDFLDEGVLQTMEILKKHGIPYIGGGKNSEDADKMLILNINGLKIGIWALAEKEYNLASETRPGTSYFFPEVNVYKIPELRKRVDFLMIFVHAGHEFMLTPSPRIRKAYRDFIKAGADIVIGHHPHVIQGIEKYENGWIAYSLGNLLFDSPYVSSYPDTDHGFMMRVKAGKHKVHKIEIIPYRIKPGLVKALPAEEIQDYKELLEKIGGNITDEKIFIEEWRKNVIYRWPDYKGAFLKLVENFTLDEKNMFLRNGKNFFQCPTHNELLFDALNMMEEGTLEK
ncbi:MAG: hypothetical protein A2017_04660 [Lentisphaerae bacterium GWF2_44_16]|nr:MAG: hypothetical protein A2017_04660 [Lentisphaerae bacterium GWF2_44_16]